jgi:hypothetical protein
MDFFIFGYLKGKLYEYSSESLEHLLNVIIEIFTGVDQEVLLSVFKSWVNWLK